MAHPKKQLLQRLKVEIPDALLTLALTHPSAAAEEGERTQLSNQRLEFLGDAIIGAAVAQHLYETEPNLPEGELTRRKIAAVRREALADAAARLGLGELLVFGRGEGAAGGATRPSNLSDAMEAVVGAIFLSSGWDVAKRVVVQELEPELRAGSRVLVPAKNRLQELTQSIGLGTPVYRTGSTAANSNVFSAEVLLMDEVRGRGKGTTKKAAQEAAAECALEAITLSARGEDELAEKLAQGPSTHDSR